MIRIRVEQDIDIPAVRAINEAAFGGPIEANIVDSIRKGCPEVVSLVAVEGDKILGHVFFSPVVVSAGPRITEGMGLGPIAVLPERQRQGIGSTLIRAGIDAMRGRSCPFVIVL